MFVKIKELPKDLKKKALKRMYQERGESDENCPLAAAFSWRDTKEGTEYWGEVSEQYSDSENFLSKLKEILDVEIEVVGAEEVKPDSIVESVVDQLRQRSDAGIKKYGTTLDRDDLHPLEWIEHAKQEAMDFVLYLEKLKQTL